MIQAFRLSVFTFILTGLFYPLLVTGMCQAVFPFQANGSLVLNSSHQVVGSRLLGQTFTQARYFHPRPSANDYDASNSGGSNWGATNQKLISRIQKEALAYHVENGVQAIPLDAVTASASGLDPHINLSNANAQVSRIATARRLSPVVIQKQVQTLAERSSFSQAEPLVNVLELNLMLDRMTNKQ